MSENAVCFSIETFSNLASSTAQLIPSATSTRRIIQQIDTTYKFPTTLSKAA